MKENAIGTNGVDRAVKLHRDLRTGLLETVYEVTLARFLEECGLGIQRQITTAIEYEGRASTKDPPDSPCLRERKMLLNQPVHRRRCRRFGELIGIPASAGGGACRTRTSGVALSGIAFR